MIKHSFHFVFVGLKERIVQAIFRREEKQPSPTKKVCKYTYMYVCVPTWLDKCLQIAKRHFTFCGAVRKSCLRLIAKYDKRQERLDEHFPSELRGWSLEENTANKTGKTTLHWFCFCFFFSSCC